jgi:uncharacterized protein YutE (UPF0331/DUF86 family)
MADINQLFDVNVDPQAKQKILSGQFNMIHCANCGYEGNVATPLVYHDPDKELLLTYFPPELGLPVNEQDRLVGPMIQQVLNKLPNEKRKGYLLRPQSMLTLQTLIEKVLEGEGITKEMIQAQQQRLNLMQRMLTATEDSLAEIAKTEDAQIDESFFSTLSRLVESAMMENDEQSAKRLIAIQQKLLDSTTVGKKLKAQVQETQEAAKSLQEASQKGLTRDILLDLIINAPTEARRNALVSMARSGLDYQFFQILSARIDAATGDEMVKLSELRDKLVQMTQEIDQQVQAQVQAVHGLLEEIIQQDDIEAAATEAIPAVNDLFVEILRGELDLARRNKNQERLAKLQRVVDVLQQASSTPPGVALIEELISAASDEDRMKILAGHKEEITPEFMESFNNLVAQTQAAPTQGEEKELADQLQSAYRAALRFSMSENLKK